MFHEEHISQELKFYLPKYTSKTEMSAGETPGILDACEMVLGLMDSNFCRDSIEMEFSLE